MNRNHTRARLGAFTVGIAAIGLSLGLALPAGATTGDPGAEVAVVPYCNEAGFGATFTAEIVVPEGSTVTAALAAPGESKPLDGSVEDFTSPGGSYEFDIVGYEPGDYTVVFSLTEGDTVWLSLPVPFTLVNDCAEEETPPVVSEETVPPVDQTVDVILGNAGDISGSPSSSVYLLGIGGLLIGGLLGIGGLVYLVSTRQRSTTTGE